MTRPQLLNQQCQGVLEMFKFSHKFEVEQFRNKTCKCLNLEQHCCPLEIANYFLLLHQQSNIMLYAYMYEEQDPWSNMCCITYRIICYILQKKYIILMWTHVKLYTWSYVCAPAMRLIRMFYRNINNNITSLRTVYQRLKVLNNELERRVKGSCLHETIQ